MSDYLAGENDFITAVDAHPNYEEIESEEYFELWDGDYPIFELHLDEGAPGGYRLEVNSIGDSDFVAAVSGGGRNGLPVYYRITSSDIEESLEVFEDAGFEHFTSDPPDPTKDPFQEVFDAIEQAGRDESADTATGEIFDGSYQCRHCGGITTIGTFAGAAKPPEKIGTDCSECDRGERKFYAIHPDATSVQHQWAISFENFELDPYRIEVTAESRIAARTQAEKDHPDRTIEFVVHDEKIDHE